MSRCAYDGSDIIARRGIAGRSGNTQRDVKLFMYIEYAHLLLLPLLLILHLELFHALGEVPAIGTETTMAASTVMTEAPGLSEITNKASAKTAAITVAVKRPQIQIWTYKAQGRQQEGAKLQCILQCEDGMTRVATLRAATEC